MKIKSRPDEEHQAYSTEDLQNLFQEPDTSKSYAFRSPLIALYTGCRLEEICQLHLEDIRKEDGIWIFYINDKHEKKLKNASSVRMIPIHPQLIKFGLLEHVNLLKVKGEQWLFPELRQRRDGYGQDVSRWFSMFTKLNAGLKNAKLSFPFLPAYLHNSPETQASRPFYNPRTRRTYDPIGDHGPLWEAVYS